MYATTKTQLHNILLAFLFFEFILLFWSIIIEKPSQIKINKINLIYLAIYCGTYWIKNTI